MLTDIRASENAAAELRYQRLRRTLQDELGVEPSQETRSLHERLHAKELIPPKPIQLPLGPSVAPPPVAVEVTKQRRRWVLAVLPLLLLLLFALALIDNNRPVRGNRLPAVVSVVASDSFDSSEFFARDLLAKLGRLQSVGSEPLQLTGQSGREQADFIFEVGGGLGGERVRVHLVLLDSRTATVLWSRDFERSAGEIGDLRQEVSSAAAKVLGCAREASSEAQLRPKTLQLYLNGCAEMAFAANASAMVPMFRQVIEAAPEFGSAWERLLSAQMDAHGVSKYQDNEILKQLRADIARAHKINPRLSQIYVAQAYLLPPDSFSQRLRLTEHAVALDSFATEPLLARASALLFMGKLNDAVENARRAVEIDPLSPRVRSHYIYMLFNSGRLEAAQKEIAEAERLWPEASSVVDIKFAFHFRYGDPAEAWQIIQSGEAHSGWFQAKSFLDARRDPASANVERAVRDATAAYEQNGNFGFFQHLVQTLSILDREREMLNLLMHAPLEHATRVVDVTFRPAAREFWDDPQSLAYAERIGLLEAWRRSGEWPDFCLVADPPYDCKAEAAKLT